MTRFLRLSFIAIVFMLAGKLYAQQACTPDPQYSNTDSQRGVYPDSATNFGPGYAGSPYIQLVTIVVPNDTQVLPSPFPATNFDSIVLVNFTGLPNGFTYACWNNSPNPNRCAWKGNTIGCMQISGNPTIADTGTYNLQFDGAAYVGGSTSPVNFSISYYKIIINPPLSVNDPQPSTFSVSQNEPNPVKGRTRINYTAPAAGDVRLVVYNMLGNTVYTSRLTAQKGTNHIDFDPAQLAPGIYMYTLSNGSTTVTKRMVVEGK
jgi:hypothetical protein